MPCALCTGTSVKGLGFERPGDVTVSVEGLEFERPGDVTVCVEGFFEFERPGDVTVCVEGILEFERPGDVTVCRLVVRALARGKIVVIPRPHEVFQHRVDAPQQIT